MTAYQSATVQKRLNISSDLKIETPTGAIEIRDINQTELRIDVENTSTLRALIKSINPRPSLIFRAKKLQPWVKIADVHLTLYVNGTPWGGVSPQKGASFDILAIAWQYLRAKLS